MKRNRKPRYRIEHGCLEWTGRTRDECERQRDAFLDVRFADSSSDVPTVVHAGSSLRGAAARRAVGVVFQRLNGDYEYVIVEEGGRPPYCIATHTGSGPDGGLTRKEAEHHCRRHLAQWIYGHDGNGIRLIAADDDEGFEQHLRWIAFQRAYARLVTEQPELSANERHRLACEQSWTAFAGGCLAHDTRILISDPANGDVDRCIWRQFAEANAHDPELDDWTIELAEQGLVHIGGGAQPHLVISREP